MSLSDPALLEEVDLMVDLIIAASGTPTRLTLEEIDRALRLR